MSIVQKWQKDFLVDYPTTRNLSRITRSFWWSSCLQREAFIISWLQTNYYIHSIVTEYTMISNVCLDGILANYKLRRVQTLTWGDMKWTAPWGLNCPPTIPCSFRLSVILLVGWYTLLGEALLCWPSPKSVEVASPSLLLGITWVDEAEFFSQTYPLAESAYK